MNKLLIFLISTSLALSACSRFERNESNNKNISKWPWFSVNSNIKFTKKIERSDGSLALITYDNAQIKRDRDDIGIYIYPDNASCPPLGVTSPSKIAIGNHEAVWGRTDFWDTSNALYFWRMRDEWKPEDAPPFCKPPLPNRMEQPYYVECAKEDDEELCDQKQRDYEVQHGMYSAYAFCAEKGGKAVAICIQQMTDDEAMAKQIFESFRWTD